MSPVQLTADHFLQYPPQAKQLAADNLRLLKALPLAFVPLLLREVIVYDWKFPAERAELDRQLSYLGHLTSEDLGKWMHPFRELRLSPGLEALPWVTEPVAFAESLSAHLWSTHQVDAFHSAAVEYVNKLTSVTTPEPTATPRIAMVAIGQGVTRNTYPLFRKLRPHGVYFSNILPSGGNEILLGALEGRARAHPVSFGHWYVDGGEALDASDKVTQVSYHALEPIRSRLLGTMEDVMRSGKGSESLRSSLARIRPDDLGLHSSGNGAVLDKFQVSLLTEGSGTQLFSTTFVQWTVREALRRAQPATLFARFAPRWHEQSMSEKLAGKQQPVLYDPMGSLIDADMGAYYTWINLQRLPGSETSSFLVWFEGHSEALAIAPSLPRGTDDHSSVTLKQLLARIT